MERLLSFILLLMIQIWPGCKGCIQEEKMSLLQFKAFMKSNDENADFLLPSWIDDYKINNISDCCNWERVTCNPTTDRVEKLFLYDIRQQQFYLDENVTKFWLINISIFLTFKELHNLNLSTNSFDGFIENQGFEALSSLKKLEILDISGNKFDRNVINSLNAITSLKTLVLRKMEHDRSFHIQELASLQNLEVLDLSYNDLESFQLAQELANLQNLKVLDLSFNNFRSFQLVQVFKGLSSFKRLEILDITRNELDENVLKHLGAITSLKRLVLSRTRLNGSFPLQELVGLTNLEVLDLSRNNLESFQQIQDSKNLSVFKRLDTLNIADNNFKNTTIQQLNIFTSLKNLYLQWNNLEGFFPIKELCTLENLMILDLSGNQLTGMQDFVSLSNLEILDLSYNSFHGSIPSSIWSLPHLKALSLAYNNLNGSLQNQGFCQSSKIEELDLSGNLLQGILPSCLNNFTSLRFLDVSGNLFFGNVSFSLFANLKSLEYIDISYNQFQVETQYPVGSVPLFQLKSLMLSNCKLFGELPGFLRYQFKLEVVDLSHNNLTGSFPYWLLENNTRLKSLHLSNNSLKGQLLSMRTHIHIQSLDVSNNQLDGQLQENVGHMFPNIMTLNLSKNSFEGILPSSIAEMCSLWILDLSSNNFSGEVPKQLLAVKELGILKLSNNKFHGEIFSTDFNLTGLECLYLDNNQFTGTLTNVISRSSSLQVLDVSNNYMSGEIPSFIGNMTYLQELILGSNCFKGKLPAQISQLQWLVFLDVSQNALSGSLPSLNNLPNLKHLHLGENIFTGFIPRDFLNSSSQLLTLDTRANRLFGSIPNSISRLSDLRILSLRGNFLSGSIPNHLCHLTKISLMDLSNNSLLGPIPKCLGDIRFGELDDVFQQSFYFGFGDYNNIYAGYLNIDHENSIPIWVKEETEEVEFGTKNRRDPYKGNILNFMSGLDLSCNNLTGEIPRELGMLSWLHALNLSHNQLEGLIPKSFSTLSQIESLDLSYNKLSGEIPPELIQLNFLEVFSVAHNNLSGRVPDMKAQFGTFEESSYGDNPFLCGRQLKRKCNSSIESSYSYSPLESSGKSEAKWYDIDHVVFFASFVASYVMILLGFATILYINPYWRRRWFYFIEECVYSCYYFALDTPSKLQAYLYN